MYQMKVRVFKMKRIIVKVDVKDGSISVKRGRFGRVHQFSGGWYTDCSINEIVAEFCKDEVVRFQKEISKNVRKSAEPREEA